MNTTRFLRADTETRWGTYAAGTPVDVLDTRGDVVLVRLAALPRYPLDIELGSWQIDTIHATTGCVECGRPTVRGPRRGLCAPCTATNVLRTKNRDMQPVMSR